MMVPICKSRLRGTLRLPPSKSHTLRALLFASLAHGVSKISNALPSPDTEAMTRACKILGATIVVDRALEITGRGTSRRLCGHSIDAQNSGQVLRFVAASATLSDDYLFITGDASIQTRRPVAALLDGIRQLGGFAVSCGQNNHAPIIVRGPLTSGSVVIDGSDSQPVSALLIAASQLEGTTRIEVEHMGEKPWVYLTLDWLKGLGVSWRAESENCFIVEGKKEIEAFSYRVPGDMSSLAFPLVAGLICDADIVIEDVAYDDVQGDKVVIELLERMGAHFVKDVENKKISVHGPQELRGVDIDINDCVDALPILAVCAAFADGSTRLYNGAVCRSKESDRIHAMCRELGKMGVKIDEAADGLTIYGSKVTGANLYSWQDHRVALALSVAAYAASTPSVLHEAACIQKSYPTFFADMGRLAAL